MIIGLAGTIGAGKGTVVEYLEDKGFAHYSSSDILREILKERGITEERGNLSALADELAGKYEGGVLHESHKRAQAAGHDSYILEALHRESEADYVRSIGGVILGVDADIKTRYERAVKRNEGEKDNVTYEQFLSDSKREDEGQGAGAPNIRKVIDGANAVIYNDGTLEELHAQIDAVLEKLKDES